MTCIALTTLLRKTVSPQGHHVMLKIDIEGGEYQLLEEAVNSTILCELRDQGVTADMALEGHSDTALGSAEPCLYFYEVLHREHKIKECGVNIKKGGAG